MRISDWSSDVCSSDRNLLGKGNLTPTGCSSSYQTCQGLFHDQIYPSVRLVSLPGTYSMRGDDGDINYDKGDLTQAVAKVTQGLTLAWGAFVFYGRWPYVYDSANNNIDKPNTNNKTKKKE